VELLLELPDPGTQVVDVSPQGTHLGFEGLVGLPHFRDVVDEFTELSADGLEQFPVRQRFPAFPIAVALPVTGGVRSEYRLLRHGRRFLRQRGGDGPMRTAAWEAEHRAGMPISR